MNSHWRTIADFVRIGSTGKTRGIDGELKLYIEDRYLDDVLQADFLFLELNGNKVPLGIESLREMQDLLIKFTGVEDPTSAGLFSSLDVFLPIDEISSVSGNEEKEELEYHELIGFVLSDKQLGDLGQILEIQEFPQQQMALLRYMDRDVLVPLNDVFILEIDRNGQKVLMDLPAGILEI